MRKALVSELQNISREHPELKFDSMSSDKDVVMELNENGKESSTYADEYIIRSVVPMTLISNEFNDTNVASLVFLCTADKIKDGDYKGKELFTLIHNYIVEDDNEDMMVRETPFHTENNYFSKHMSENMIMQNCKSFITDLRYFSSNTGFYMYAVENKEKSIAKLNLPINVFSSIAFIDQYITENINNKYDLEMAIIFGFNFDESNSLFMVDTIGSPIVMCEAQQEKKHLLKKENSNVAFIVPLYHFINKYIQEKIKLLTCLEADTVFDKSKYKGATMNDVNKSFNGEDDQYIGNFMTNIKFVNTNKEYLLIKASNRKKQSLLIMLDNDMQDMLVKVVNEY